MEQLIVHQSACHGTISLPPSKSHTQRALLFALMGSGISHIHHYLASPDIEHMLNAILHLGAKLLYRDHALLTIQGVHGHLQPAEDVLFAGNSGQLLRFLGALSSLLPTYTILTGDVSIRHNRPVLPLLHGITQRGGFAVSANNNGTAPIIIKGPIQPGPIAIDGMCSQAVSGFLMACSFLEGESSITVHNRQEAAWLRLTLSWLDFLHISYTHHNLEHFTLHGHATYSGFTMTIPGDLSSAAFPLVAALLTHSSITILHVDRDSYQGDDLVIDLLTKLGAHLTYDSVKKTLHVDQCIALQGGIIDLSNCIDAVPIFCVVGCKTTSPLTLINIEGARHKESDRLSSMTQELRKMGAKIDEEKNRLTIYPSRLHGAILHSHHDHRIAMALSIAGFLAQGTTLIEETACVAKSYPHYAEAMGALGFAITTDFSS